MTRTSAVLARIKQIAAKISTLKPVRVFLNYTENRGPLMAAGLSFHAIFTAFAALWIGFATAGLFLQEHPALLEAFLDLIRTAVPGLISDGTSEGAVEPDDLLQPMVLNVTRIVAAIVLLFTALGWLDACRQAVRAIFELPPPSTGFLLLKLKDLGLAIAFSVAVIVSAALSLFGAEGLSAILSFIGISGDSFIAGVFGRILGLTVMFALDITVLAALFRILAGVPIPAARLLRGAFLGAVGLGLLKVLGNLLLGGATRNPLLASFAVIIGLLIWFNFVCQVILASASWIAVDLADHRISIRPDATGDVGADR